MHRSDLPVGVLVDRECVDHPHGVALPQTLEFVDDLAVEVRGSSGRSHDWRMGQPNVCG